MNILNFIWIILAKRSLRLISYPFEEVNIKYYPDLSSMDRVACVKILNIDRATPFVDITIISYDKLFYWWCLLAYLQQ